MPASDHVWSCLSRTDVAVSLAGAAMPWISGALEHIPWTYRIPAMALTACALLWLWRHLSMRRMLVPYRLQSNYADDVLYVGELFEGRAMISNVTFRRTELKGPGAIYLEGNCRVVRAMHNPNIHVLAVIPQPGVNLMAFYRFRNCVFDDCIFTGVGLIIDSSNSQLHGLVTQQIELPIPAPKPASQDGGAQPSM